MYASWWHHQMETFSALLALCAGNSPVTGEFPSQRPVTRSFGVFFDLRLNKRLNKQSWGWWLETTSRSLWRRCNDSVYHKSIILHIIEYERYWQSKYVGTHTHICWDTNTYTKTFEFPFHGIFFISHIKQPQGFILNTGCCAYLCCHSV